MDISVIIVNYKSLDKTLKCLDSLKNADWGSFSHEIIVVDNASGNGDAAAIASKHPEAILVKSEKNLGMGGGNNLGAKASKGRYLLVLNPDTLIKGDAVPKMAAYLDAHPQVAIVGPKLLNSDGTLQYSCLRFPKLHTPILRRTFFGGLAGGHLDEFLMKDYDHKNTREVDWLMGSCLMVRRDILERDGFLFDEKFFMYFEDTELCRRVQKNHGMKVVYFPEASVVHDHARQSADKPWYIAPFVDSLTREHLKSWLKYFLPFK
jgi:GT2 family glycosyltransferase